MRLEIVKERPVTDDVTGDTMRLHLEDLQLKTTHLFIASNYWDEVSIDLTDSIDPEWVKYLPMNTKKVSVTLPEVVSDKLLLILTTLFPDKAGKLRRTYMIHGDLAEVLACTE